MALVEIRKDPSAAELRWFGLIAAGFFGVIGAIALWRFDAAGAARTLWAVGGGLAVVYYAVPPLRRWLFVGWMAAVFPIAWTISHLVLAAAFYLVLTPIGLLMRLVGRDPMERRFRPDAPSYWIEHRTGQEPSRYFRQF